MRRASLLIAVALLGCSSQLTSLDLGDPLPSDANSTEEAVITAPAQIWPRHRWVDGGIEYSVAADTEGRVQYIATDSTGANTSDGVSVGQQLVRLLELEGTELVLWPGWGYVVELPSGWNAALFLDGEFLEREPTAADRVDLLFKGTMAGYGS